MKKITLLAVFCLGFLLPSVTLAANHYVRPDGAGNGTSWSAALGRIPSAPVRGDIYYVASGIYNDSYDFSGSGSTVTIKKATIADHGDNAGWNANYDSGPAQFKPITFSGSGFVFDGVRHYGFLIKADEDQSSLISIGGANITIKNTEMTAANMNIRVSGVYAVDGPTNLVVDNVYIHDFFGVAMHLIDGGGITLSNSTIARNRSTNASSRFPDGDPRNNWHSEGIQARSTKNLTIKNNLFKDIQGTAEITCGSGACGDWYIYNNIFDGSKGLYSEEGGVSALVSDNPNDEPGSISNVLFHHNVIANMFDTGNPGVKFAKSPSGNFAYNNIWYNSDWIGMQGVTHGYNSFYNSETNFEYRDGSGNRIGDVSLSGSPFVSATDFHLKAHTTAGKTLLSPYNIDRAGKTRVVWDRGAYEYGSGEPASDIKDTQSPSITITSPTSGVLYKASGASLTVAGTASDNVGVTRVSWTNFLGGSGTAVGTTNWSIAGIPLKTGNNLIVVTARDAAGNTKTDSLAVAYTSPSCVVISQPLSYGDGETVGIKDSDIKKLQTFLAGLNYSETKKVTATGFYGKNTLAAVKKFQSINPAITVSGNVNSATIAKIYAVSCGN